MMKSKFLGRMILIRSCLVTSSLSSTTKLLGLKIIFAWMAFHENLSTMSTCSYEPVLCSTCSGQMNGILSYLVHLAMVLVSDSNNYHWPNFIFFSCLHCWDHRKQTPCCFLVFAIMFSAFGTNFEGEDKWCSIERKYDGSSILTENSSTH